MAKAIMSLAPYYKQKSLKDIWNSLVESGKEIRQDGFEEYERRAKFKVCSTQGEKE